MKIRVRGIKTILLGIGLSAFTCTSYYAASFKPWNATNNIVNPDKEWNIKYSTNLDKTSAVNMDNIYVLDSKGIKVDTLLFYDDKNMSVTIKPLENYNYGQSYKLFVTQNLKSNTGKNLLSPISMGFSIIDSSQSVNFTDINLEDAVREAINKPYGDILQSEILGIKTLDASFRDINDISGIEKLVNLTSLDLSYNNISDISKLSSLTKLNKLYLSNNKITDYTPINSYYSKLSDTDFIIDESLPTDDDDDSNYDVNP